MNNRNKSKASIKVIGIAGSLREGSYSRKVIQLALKGAAERGAETQLIDLRNYQLVFYGATTESEYPQDVFKLREEVKKAQGIMLATPEYHGSLSGVLKNALDLMGFNEFEGKMIGLIGVSGGRLGAINALNTLRSIGRTLHAWVLPQQVSIPEVQNHFDRDGNLADAEIINRLLDVGRLVAQFASLHEIQKDQEFIKMWEELPVNPGGNK